MSDLAWVLIVPLGFVVGIFVLLIFLAWLEEPHEWRRPRHAGADVGSAHRDLEPDVP